MLSSQFSFLCQPVMEQSLTGYDHFQWLQSDIFPSFGFIVRVNLFQRSVKYRSELFYEFVPLEEVGKENPRAYCLEEVELNKNYAMVISTSCGLWRYMIGDTVKFTSKNPYKFVITGRTKHFINAFGEELIVDNAEKGLAKACAETGAQVSEYTAAPVFMDENAKCRHQWLIEFAKMPDSVEKFAAILDATLKEVNSDYEAKRWKDIALQPLEVIVAREGLFHDWLAQKGKLGGQHKVPRLSNTREYIETMLALNDSIPSEE